MTSKAEQPAMGVCLSGDSSLKGTAKSIPCESEAPASDAPSCAKASDDKLPECREAFEKWWKDANPCNSLERAKLYPDKYFTAFADYGWQSWQASRSAFAAELIEKFRKQMTAFNENEHPIFMGVIALTRQMAGEK